MHDIIIVLENANKDYVIMIMLFKDSTTIHQYHIVHNVLHVQQPRGG